MKQFPIYVETAGRSCDGCTKCCEGWLVANIYGFEMNPTDGACKFLAKHGCGIYPIREPLCKNFQCDWKENTRIPLNMKPDISGVIIMSKRKNNFIYQTMVVAGEVKEYVYDWAKEQAEMGKNIIGYTNQGKFAIFSNNKEFKNFIMNEYTQVDND